VAARQRLGSSSFVTLAMFYAVLLVLSTAAAREGAGVWWCWPQRGGGGWAVADGLATKTCVRRKAALGSNSIKLIWRSVFQVTAAAFVFFQIHYFWMMPWKHDFRVLFFRLRLL
jgi:hypothetical protein